jgi:two-component system LytT family sensor kinase
LSIPGDWLFFWTSGAVENLLCSLIAYTSYHFVSKLNSKWKKGGLVIFFITTLGLLASLKDHRIHDSTSLDQTFEYFTNFLGRTLLFYFLVFMVDRLELLGRYQKLEKELNQAREQLLRNQLHPHFLFNAFNSLYSLSLKNHPETPDYILKLSGMMRYLTDETHWVKVPLHKELDFIEKYISIEKIRFGEDARIQLHMEDRDRNEKWIEPFLLITLVENAFKHGFYTNAKEAFVKIDIHIEHNYLQLTVENSIIGKQHFHESNREGKGLDNLKRRLALLYPKNSDLEITISPTAYSTHLKITLTNEPV